MFSFHLTFKILKLLPSHALLQQQTVRWIRKPRKPFWLGTAKSKIFRIPEPPVLAQEEKDELFRLDKHYKTSIKSIRAFLESSDSMQIDAIKLNIQRVSDVELEESLIKNDIWNAECASIREERLKRNALEHGILAEHVIEKVDKKRREFEERVEELVRVEKEKSETFINAENLDQKIEECLSKEVNYNYAIDLEGNIYTELETHKPAASPQKIRIT